MAKPNRYPTGSPTDYAPMCAGCRDKEPNVRYAHYLHSAKVLGLDDAYEHVLEDLNDRLEDPARARDYALTIKYWLAEQMGAYEHVVDEYTGAFLPWWEGRARSIQAMYAMYEALGKANILATQEREVRRYVKGFVSVGEVEAQTPMREPGEEADDD